MDKNVCEILVNSVRNIDSKYDIHMSKSLDEINKLSPDELVQYAFELSCSFAGCLYDMHKVVEYIRFVENNKDLINSK